MLREPCKWVSFTEALLGRLSCAATPARRVCRRLPRSRPAAREWVPASRSRVENAAPHPGHESLPGRNERRIRINLSNSTLTASLRRGEARRTSDTPSRPRDALRPSNSSSLTLKWRAQGMPGAKPAPIASRANEKSTRAKSLQVKPFNRHSLRDGFTVSFVLSPGNRAFLPPSPVGSSPTGLMSASRHQDHTASPSALPAFVFASRSVHRIPRSTLVTIA